MTRLAIQALDSRQQRAFEALRQAALIVGASIFVAVCAHITIPLMPLTPVPLTVQNLAVLLVGLFLGSRRGFAALLFYLVEGMVGLPVFSPTALRGNRSTLRSDRWLPAGISLRSVSGRIHLRAR